MFDENDRRINAAGPSTPVAVMGLGDLPQPGDSFAWVKNDKRARRLLHERAADLEQGSGRMDVLSLDDVFARFNRGGRERSRAHRQGGTFRARCSP